jgi:Ca2+-binding EF-hand superfamily protein
MWEEHDADGNGFLCREEAQKFITELATIIEPSKAKHYQPHNFDNLFDEFDEDGNGYLSKSELAVLTKKTFKDKSQD